MFWFQGGSQTSCDFRFIDAVDAENLALGVVRDRRSHPQPGAVSVIFTSTFVPPSGLLGQLAIVNQAEIDDVYRDFRIVTLLELVPDRFFIDRRRLLLASCCRAVRLRLFQTERIQILFRDAGQTR